MKLLANTPCIAVVKWSCAPLAGRLLLACVVAMANFCSADAADDPRSATRATGTNSIAAKGAAR